MTFKKCRVCGEQKIIWDLDASGQCEDKCFESYDKHVGIKLNAPDATEEQKQRVIDAALKLCYSAGPAKEAAKALRHMDFNVHQTTDSSVFTFVPVKPPHLEKSVGDYVGRLSEKYGFTQPEDGSEARFEARSERQAAMRHTFWWLVHNAVAHPLIAFVPRHFAFEFHDWTSRKLHGK